MSVFETLRKRLRRYHSSTESFLFGFALLGVLVVTHLFLQQSRGFEDGCVGVSGLETAPQTFDCAAVVNSSAGTLLGLSNVLWGLGFYVTVAVLTVIGLWLSPVRRQWVQGGRTGILGGGLAYTGYLTYVQTVALEALCVLCLISAGIVALLFVLQCVALVTDSESAQPLMNPRSLKREIVRYAFLAGLAVVLIGADLFYFQESSRSQRAEKAQSEGEEMVCELASTPPLEDKGRGLVSFRDIRLGNSESDVLVIEFFDPNCPHCKTFHGTMSTLFEEYGPEVRFVFKPFYLRPASIPEIQALYVAHQQGKFVDMLEAQYERQGPSGITTEDLRAAAEQVDMNGDGLLSRVQQGLYRDHILQSRKRAVDAGVDSTPTVVVNGHFVESRSLECMRTFVEQAQNGTLGPTASR